MISIDLRTTVFIFMLTDLIITLIMMMSWIQNRKLFPGIGFWVLNFAFQTIALALIALRGTIPELFSIVVSNTLVISGNLLGLSGLERFAGLKGKHFHNYIVIFLFVTIHLWFTFIKPDLQARNLNLALTFLFFNVQFVWLSLFRVKNDTRRLAFNIGIVYLLYSLLNIVRVVNYFTAGNGGNDYFRSGGFETVVFIAYQMLFILLTYNLVLMFNRKLIMDNEAGTKLLKESEALLQAAMDCSPAGIAIADAPSGNLRYVNKAGLLIPAKSEDDLVKDIDINKYVASWNIKHHDGTPYKTDEVPLARAVMYGESVSKEFIISRDENEDRIVLANAAPIIDESGTVKAGIVVFTDITEFKQAEEKIKRLNVELEDIVNQRTTQLQDTLDLNQKIIETSSVGIFACRGDGPCVIANEAIARISGATVNRMLEINFRELDTWKKNGLSQKIETALQTREEQKAEINLLTAFGRDVWINYYITTFTSGGILHFLMLVDDITERKLAEIELTKNRDHLEERRAQVEAANKELEAFSYSVSHDLRAPLRAIHSFTGILREDYGTELNEEGRRICGVIESSTAQMGKLIDDLIAFSRFGRTTLGYSRIDMTKLIKGVFTDLSGLQKHRKTDFSIDKLPAINGDLATIKQVIINLISNALKYTAGSEKPVIHVGFEQNDSEIEYFIKDNGVGFNMKYVNKLFGVFQRLHSTSEFEGNGVGLAIVQRIILRHGGRVWAESETGKGATFYFALPVREANDQSSLKLQM